MSHQRRLPAGQDPGASTDAAALRYAAAHTDACTGRDPRPALRGALAADAAFTLAEVDLALLDGLDPRTVGRDQAARRRLGRWARQHVEIAEAIGAGELDRAEYLLADHAAEYGCDALLARALAARRSRMEGWAVTREGGRDREEGAMRHRMGLVLDCRDAEGLAAFWAEALGYQRVGAAGTYVLLVDADGAGPQLLLQQVGEEKQGKNRMHLDLHTPDVDGEVERLAALGARRVADPQTEHGSRWVVMADPEGNEFCVCSAGAGEAP